MGISYHRQFEAAPLISASEDSEQYKEKSVYQDLSADSLDYIIAMTMIEHFRNCRLAAREELKYTRDFTELYVKQVQNNLTSKKALALNIVNAAVSAVAAVFLGGSIVTPGLEKFSQVATSVANVTQPISRINDSHVQAEDVYRRFKKEQSEKKENNDQQYIRECSEQISKGLRELSDKEQRRTNRVAAPAA